MNLTTHGAELRDRVEATKKRLEARIATMRAEGRGIAREQREQIEVRLRELKEIIGNGWNRISEATASRLNSWLERTELELERHGDDRARADTEEAREDVDRPGPR